MIKFFCNCCDKEPSQEFILDGTIFETRIPFDAVNLNQPKQLKKTQIHLCQNCYDKYLGKHIRTQ